MTASEEPFGELLLSTEAAHDVRTVAKGGFLQIAGQVTHAGISFLFTAIAVRILGTASFGLYRQVTQVLTFAGQLGHAGFNYAALHFIAKARATGDHAGVRGAARITIAGAALVSSIAFLVLLLGAEPIAKVFAESPADVNEIAFLFRIGSPYVPLVAMTVVLIYCTLGYKSVVPSVAVGNLIEPVARFVLGTGALLIGLDVVGAVGSFTIAMAIGLMAAAWYFRRMMSSEEASAPPRARSREIVKFAVFQAGVYLLDLQTMGIGILLLGILAPDEQVALFAIGSSLQLPGQLFLFAVANIWSPVVSDLYGRGDLDRLARLIKTISRWIATFSLPVFAILIVHGNLFFEIFTGTSEPDAGVVIALLAIGNLAATATGATAYLISMMGRPAINFGNATLAMVLYVVLGVLVVPEHGALGMAAVDAVVQLTVTAARVLEARLVIGIQPFGKTILKPFVASLCLLAALYLWKEMLADALPLQLVGVGVSAGLYVAVLALFGIDPEERHVLERIKERILTRRPSR